MEMAKVTSKGQITIPRDIRAKMNLKKGDKIVFLESNGSFFIQNASSIDIKLPDAVQNGADPEKR
jgi:AbrB family looped-hinge helix DNA binding protein